MLPNPLDWLDTRRRAMLREMGIRTWQAPALVQSVTAASDAPEMIAARAREIRPESTFGLKKSGIQALAKPPNPVPSGVASAPSAVQGARWALGRLQPLDTAPAAAAVSAPVRWLVLCEATAPHADVLAGPAGGLLHNMLRAAQTALPRLAGLQAPAAAGLAIQIAAWAPQSAATDAALQSPPPPSPSPSLAQAVAEFQPDVLLLLMGRSAALAMLEPTADWAALPLNQLRSQRHTLFGCPAFLSHDLQSLLRTPARKAQAWEDLCQALATSWQARLQRS